MKTEKHQRSSYLIAEWLPLGRRPVYIIGYDKSEKFVCRLEINAAGVAVFSGEKGRKKLCNLSWENFVRKLTDEK